MELKERLTQIAPEYLEDESFFIVDVIVKGLTGGKTKILVLLDGDEGVNIDACAKLSRALGAHIETEDLIEQAFILEVSSPGLDHPLSTKRQFHKNVGRSLKLTLTDASIIQGELLEVQEASLQLNKEIREKKKVMHEPVQVPFEEIEKANVVVSFK